MLGWQVGSPSLLKLTLHKHLVTDLLQTHVHQWWLSRAVVRWKYLRGGVEHVDEHQTESDKEHDPGRHDVRGDEERDLDNYYYALIMENQFYCSPLMDLLNQKSSTISIFLPSS